MSIPPLDTTDESPNVLILGGWSPGPLLYLKRNFFGRCVFLEPEIPMPPVGISWCFDVGILLLVVVAVLAIWACIALAGYVNSRGWLVVSRLSVIVTALFLSRLCVAAVVRGSISKGVNIASKVIREQNVNVVIGFSWGGGVVTEMLKLGLVGGTQQPTVMLIAPTNALMASFALRKDPSLTIRLTDDRTQRVHVFHGSEDETFCPHSERWELTGATFHLVYDNHVFCRRESVHELSHVLAALIANC